MTFTPEQHDAIYTHDRNLIVVAGAGSGKTRVLVERYLALLDAHPDWTLNALVAITFTHKAAQEMRDRVRQALQERLQEAATLKEQARWANLLASMDSARIDTIHALCATLLRTNAAEAGIDPRFRIIDNDEARLLRHDVVERVLTHLIDENARTAELFAHYPPAQIRAVLVAYATKPLPTMPDTPAEIMQRWVAQWQQNAERVLLAAQDDPLLREALDWANDTTFPAGDKLAVLWEETLTALQLVASYQPGGSVGGCMDGLTFISDEVKLNVGSAKLWDGKEAVTEAKDGLRAVRDWAQHALELIGTPPGEIDERAAELMPLWLDLLRRVQKGYAAVKAAEDVMDFDDLEQHTVTLLREHPSVRQRYLGEAFKHVLVDEFQDTNHRQWAIIQALTDPEHHPGRLFVVGDPKQSIYGFRGADVAVFEEVRRLLNDVGNTRGDKSAEIPLVRSFRSHAPLIGAFNEIFGWLMGRDGASVIGAYEVDYGKPMSAHRSDPPSEAPPLEILLIDQNATDDRLSAEEARTWEAVELAGRLKVLIEDEQRPVYDDGEHRPMRYSDVAMLFRARSDMNLYEDALRAQGINYVTVAGRGYYSRQEVWDLMSLLECLYNPYDDLALAAALRSPLFTLSDEALFALRLPRDGELPHLWDALTEAALEAHEHLPAAERDQVSFAHRVLGDLRALAGRVTISELLSRAVAQTGYLATLAGLPDGTRRRANVEKLLKKAAHSGHTTLSAFSQYLNDMSDNEVREGEAEPDVSDAVTLMTVHASKGLEFPLVVIPDASRTGGGGNSPVFVSDPALGAVCVVLDEAGDRQKPFAYQQINAFNDLKDDAERKRLLYVAATRAQDYLLVSGMTRWEDKKAAWKANGWLGWLLDELELADVTAAEALVDYDWGQVRLWCPGQPQGMTTPTRITGDDPPLWERRSVLAGKPLPGEVETPPLVRPVPVQPQQFARNLTATQIADLGGADYHTFYSERFRRSVLQSAPARVKQVTPADNDKPGVSSRVLGEIVHEALRWWRFPDRENDMTAELTSYAWKLGVVQPDDLHYAVNTARGWLRDMRYTRLYRAISQSERVYRELPFVYETEQRVIHGVIDVLFQQPDSKWVIVDYKSSLVPGYFERSDDAAERENRRLLTRHAERYYLQVGVYAAAVGRYLDALGDPLEPDELLIYIHYLRYGQAVTVQHQQWAEAMKTLETKIGQLIEE